MIELAARVKGQSKNVNKDIADLQIKIDEINSKITSSPSVEESSLLDILMNS